MTKNIYELAKWEYEALKDDLKKQGEDWEYTGGFDAWYKEVFFLDEAWNEIIEQYIIENMDELVTARVLTDEQLKRLEDLRFRGSNDEVIEYIEELKGVINNA